MGRIIFTDTIGAAVLHNNKPAPANRFANWKPSPLPYGDKTNRQSDHALTMIRYGDDFGATFDLTQIPVQAQKTNLIEVNGDITGTLTATPTGFALTAPNAIAVELARSGGMPADVGYNGLIALHTRNTGTGDTNCGGITTAITTAHHYTGSAWVYIPSASTVSAVALDFEFPATSSVIAAADMTKRDQWQLLTTTATSTSTTTGGLVLRLTGVTNSFCYSDLWSITDADDGLFTRMVDIADRLAYHLENGGQCEVDTGDFDGNSYATCGLAAGASAQLPTLSDKRNLEYTLSLSLINLAVSPARMRCHYL